MANPQCCNGEAPILHWFVEELTLLGVIYGQLPPEFYSVE
jgi:hypothetical protein